METQYVFVIDGVCNRISVQLFLENIGGRFVRTLFTVYLRIGRISSKIGVPVKPNSCELGKNSLIAL